MKKQVLNGTFFLEVINLSGIHLSKIESDVVLGFLQENKVSLRIHQHRVALEKIIEKLQSAKW